MNLACISPQWCMSTPCLILQMLWVSADCYSWPLLPLAYSKTNVEHIGKPLVRFDISAAWKSWQKTCSRLTPILRVLRITRMVPSIDALPTTYEWWICAPSPWCPLTPQAFHHNQPTHRLINLRHWILDQMYSVSGSHPAHAMQKMNKGTPLLTVTLQPTREWVHFSRAGFLLCSRDAD